MLQADSGMMTFCTASLPRLRRGPACQSGQATSRYSAERVMRCGETLRYAQGDSKGRRA